MAQDTPFIIDAKALINALSDTDTTVPGVVLSMLDIYLRNGPFEFDAAKLAPQIEEGPIKMHIEPEELVMLQPILERFFEETDSGWAPRRGVLSS